MAKKETKLSPLGEAKWAHIHEPKPPYQGKGDPKFEIDVVFEKGGEWDAIGKEVATISKENGFEQMPIKKEKVSNISYLRLRDLQNILRVWLFFKCLERKIQEPSMF